MLGGRTNSRRVTRPTGRRRANPQVGCAAHSPVFFPQMTRALASARARLVSDSKRMDGRDGRRARSDFCENL
jgi:hypothetical protein